MPENLARGLFEHLFRGDGDEHGAVIAAGVARSERGTRLLARELFIAQDGVDYVPGERGYRMLRAEFVTDMILRCRDQGLAYLAVHNHGGTDYVAFSPDDWASHERGYPALLDIARGQPVGGLVFARNAIAGDIWFRDGSRLALSDARIVGSSVRTLSSEPQPVPPGRAPEYDRQARLFGDAGQDLLARLKVGVVGVGGAGSLLVEYLSRLGVGWIVVVDPDRVEASNLPRLVGATRWDARTWFATARLPRWVQKLGARLSGRKVAIARRVARAANPKARFDAIHSDIAVDRVARQFADCDFLFLSADTNQARLVFNALVHQYLIPGIQVGAKVPVDPDTGAVRDVFTVCRPVTPSSGCLWCNGLISPEGLQKEALSQEEARAQQYVDEPNVIAPSVITLNAVAASLGANDFLFALTGLGLPGTAHDYLYVYPRRRSFTFEIPRRDDGCVECGVTPPSRFGRGDGTSLPTKQA